MKAGNRTSWSKAGRKPGEVVRAPLIISPQAGNSVTKKMKEIFRKFALDHNIHLKVITRGGNKMSRDLKSNH